MQEPPRDGGEPASSLHAPRLTGAFSWKLGAPGAVQQPPRDVRGLAGGTAEKKSPEFVGLPGNYAWLSRSCGTFRGPT